jgi:hypothetical protein
MARGRAYDHAWPMERVRLAGLEVALDPGTREHLARLGVGPGTAVLRSAPGRVGGLVACGAGITRWPAAQVSGRWRARIAGSGGAGCYLAVGAGVQGGCCPGGELPGVGPPGDRVRVFSGQDP